MILVDELAIPGSGFATAASTGNRIPDPDGDLIGVGQSIKVDPDLRVRKVLDQGHDCHGSTTRSHGMTLPRTASAARSTAVALLPTC